MVQISDSSVVQVVGRTKKGPEKLYQYMSTIVSDVIKTTAQLSSELEATSYIVHPYTPAMWECAKATPPDSLYPFSSIIRSISDGEDLVLSLPRQTGRHPCKTSLTELFGGWSPPLSVVQEMDFKREPQRAPLSSSLPSVPSSSSSQSGAPAVAEGEPTVPEDGEGPGQVPTPGGLSPPASTGGAAQTKSQAGVTAQSEPTAPQDGQSHPDGKDTSTHFSIDSTPSFQAIRKFIVRQVASDWSLVAIYLGLESSVIRMTRTDHPQQCEDACADIFERWLSWETDTGERERTWRTVLSVVEEAGHKAFVNRLKAVRFNLH